LELERLAVQLDGDRLRPYRHGDAPVGLDSRSAVAELDARGRIACRKRLGDGLVARVAVVDAEGLERLDERLLRLPQRHAVLRPPRPGERGLNIGKIELD